MGIRLITKNMKITQLKASALIFFATISNSALADLVFNLESLNNLERPNMSGLYTQIAESSLSLSESADSITTSLSGITSAYGEVGALLGLVATGFSAMQTIVDVTSASSTQEIISKLSPINTEKIEDKIDSSIWSLRNTASKWLPPGDSAFISLNDAAMSLLNKESHSSVINIYKQSLAYKASASMLEEEIKTLATDADTLSREAYGVASRASQLFDIVTNIPSPGFDKIALNLLAIEETHKELGRKSSNLATEARSFLTSVQEGAKSASAAAIYLSDIANSSIATAHYSFSAPPKTDSACGFTIDLIPHSFPTTGLYSLPRFIVGGLHLTALPDFKSTRCAGSFDIMATREIFLPVLLGGGKSISSGIASIPYDWTVVLDNEGNYTNDLVTFTSIQRQANIVFSTNPSATLPLIGSIQSPFKIIDILSPDSNPEMVKSIPEPKSLALVSLGLAVSFIVLSKKKPRS